MSLVLTLALAVYFLAIYRPLARRLRMADDPLVTAWNELAATNAACAACAGLALGGFDDRLRDLREASTNLAASSELMLERIAPTPELQARLDQTFRIIDYQSALQTLAERVNSLAREQKVELDPAVTTELPGYSIEDPDRVFVWARLDQTAHLLFTAIQCDVAAIRSLTQLPTVIHRHGADGRAALREFPMLIELVGSADTVTRFLSSLPLRGVEVSELGLNGALTNKPAMFIDRLMLRKSSPQRPDEIVAEVRISGFAPVGAGRLEGS